MGERNVITILSVIIGLLLGWLVHLDSRWAISYKQLETKRDTLAVQVLILESDVQKYKQSTLVSDRQRLEAIRQHQVDTERLLDEIRETHLQYQAGIKEIDEVNSDSMAYGKSRFHEGYMKALYTGCMVRYRDGNYCGQKIERLYNNKVWEEYEVPEWERIWQILRGLKDTI